MVDIRCDPTQMIWYNNNGTFHGKIITPIYLLVRSRLCNSATKAVRQSHVEKFIHLRFAPARCNICSTVSSNVMLLESTTIASSTHTSGDSSRFYPFHRDFPHYYFDVFNDCSLEVPWKLQTIYVLLVHLQVLLNISSTQPLVVQPEPISRPSKITPPTAAIKRWRSISIHEHLYKGNSWYILIGFVVVRLDRHVLTFYKCFTSICSEL